LRPKLILRALRPKLAVPAELILRALLALRPELALRRLLAKLALRPHWRRVKAARLIIHLPLRMRSAAHRNYQRHNAQRDRHPCKPSSITFH
jgi:hypothetical protein